MLVDVVESRTRWEAQFDGSPRQAELREQVRLDSVARTAAGKTPHDLEAETRREPDPS